MKPTVSRRKEIIQISAELIEIENIPQNKNKISKIEERSGCLRRLMKLTKPWLALLKK